MNYFDILPDEIIERHIFVLLKASKSAERKAHLKSDLKSLLLVCKRFNSIILTSISLMAGFTLKISNRMMQESDKYPLTILRYYPAWELYEIAPENEDELFEEMIDYMHYLKCLSVFGPTNGDQFVHMLTIASNIREIKLHSIDCFIEHTFTANELPNLKSLTMVGCCASSMLKMFQNCNIEHLSVFSCGEVILPSNVSWKIRQLAIGAVNSGSFSSFAKIQKPHVKELDIQLTDKVILEIANREFSDLTKLKIVLISESRDHSFKFLDDEYEELKLKELIITDNRFGCDDSLIDSILRSYDMIEKLTLNVDSWTPFYDVELPNLKSLHCIFKNCHSLILRDYSRLRSLTLEAECIPFSGSYYIEELTIIGARSDLDKIPVRFPATKHLIFKNCNINAIILRRLIVMLDELEVLQINDTSFKIDSRRIFLNYLTTQRMQDMFGIV